jgi:NAD(P)-dependent dehydrogenase (short-subunit alcohol dehydrogenase family)
MPKMYDLKPNQQIAIVTGANSGIGRVTARELALRDYHVFLACRSEARTAPVLREIAELSGGHAKAEFIALDLSDFDSVRRCAAAFLARGLPLHLLVANAGLAGQRGMTPSGFELAFGTCHVGHFLLEQLLEPTLKASAPARVVVVASKMHRHAEGIDFSTVRCPTKTRTATREYGVAKLANILFAKELGRRLAGSGVTTYSLHPGIVGTDVWRSIPWPLDRLMKLFMISPEEGARTSLFCATDVTLSERTGEYYDECKAVDPSPIATDRVLAERLWKQSEAWVA